MVRSLCECKIFHLDQRLVGGRIASFTHLAVVPASATVLPLTPAAVYLTTSSDS
jgi:hypothetical protein